MVTGQVCKWLSLHICKRSDEVPAVGGLNDSYSYEAVVVWKGKLVETGDVGMYML